MVGILIATERIRDCVGKNPIRSTTIMLTIQNGIPVDLALTSVILEANTENDFNLFHCWRCGYKLFQFSGNALMIVPGETLTALPIIQRCHRCAQRFLLNSIL